MYTPLYRPPPSALRLYIVLKSAWREKKVEKMCLYTPHNVKKVPLSVLRGPAAYVRRAPAAAAPALPRPPARRAVPRAEGVTGRVKNLISGR